MRDKSLLRRIIFASQKLIDRCMMGEDEPDDILAGAEETLLKLGEARVKTRPSQRRGRSSTAYEGGINAFLDPASAIKGISTGFIKFDEMTGGCTPGDLFILAARPVDGQDGAGAEHRAARGARSMKPRPWRCSRSKCPRSRC